MPFSVAYKNGMLAGYLPDTLSLHFAIPGADGANEIAGGSPAYARKAVTWNAPSGGEMALANDPAFDIPAGMTVAYAGLWKAGVYLGYVTVTSQSFTTQGVFTADSGTIDLNATASA